MGLLTLLPLLGLSPWLARSLRIEHSVALLHGVAAIVLVLYVGGLAGVLWWSALAVHVVGVGMLGHEAWRAARGGAPRSVPLAYVLLVGLTVLFWSVHGDSEYLYYDEYSHWGVFVKEMLALDGFWLADTNSMHPRYPPGAPLWQYLFGAFREPHEGTAYVAQFVLLLTPLLPLFDRLSWRQAPWALAVFALCVLALTDFGLGISSLYLDHVIAVWFAGILLCFVRESPEELRRVARYSAPLALLALLKPTSLPFALAAAGIMAAVVLHRRLAARAGVVASARKALAVLLLLMLPGVACVQVWAANRDALGTPADLEAVGGIASGVADGSKQVTAEQGAEITRRFVEVFVDQQLSNDAVSREFNAFSYDIRGLYTDSFRLTTLGLFVAFALWWAIVLGAVLGGDARWRWGIVAGGVGVTAALYIVGLYLTYRYAAGEYGLVISSYTRYVHTAALSMVLLSFAVLLPAFREPSEQPAWLWRGRPVSRGAALVLGGLVALYVFETPHWRPLVEPNFALDVRRQLEPLTVPVQGVVGRSKLWVYFPADQPNGAIGRILQYLLAPTPTTIERKAEFFAAEPGEILAGWSRFDFVWLPVELDTAVANRLRELGVGATDERLFAVVKDERGATGLAPLGGE